MTTTEMKQAMKTLKQFSDKDRDYHAFQARQNFIREQLTRQHELDVQVFAISLFRPVRHMQNMPN